MQHDKTAARIGLRIIGILAALVAMGSECEDISLVFPIVTPPVVVDPGPEPVSTVLIELVNTSAYEVDPFLFVEPDETAPFNIVVSPENEILVDPPVAPGEIVSIELDCFEVGAIVSDHAALLLPIDPLLSDNGPLVRGGIDFLCGDTVSFIFIDEVGGSFFTRVEVNGEFVAD